MKKDGSEKLNKESVLSVFLLILLVLELAAAAVLSTRLFRSDGGRNQPIALAEEGFGAVLGFKGRAADGKTELHGEENGFYVRDEDKIWEKETEVEIFHIHYDENGNAVYTVESSSGDKVLAPGTENEYRFTLINTLKVPLNYILEVECRVEGDDGLLPVEARLSDASGRYLVGSGADWAPVQQLNGITDEQDLGAEENQAYALEWRWPFERSDAANGVGYYDGQDTWLGNEAVGRDITLTIVLRTSAEIGRDYAGRSWALVNLICAVLSVGIGIYEFVFFCRGRKEDKEAKKDGTYETPVYKKRARRRRNKIWDAIPAVGAVVAFILTEDMRLPMIMVDRWTLLMLVILAISVTVGLLTKIRRRRDTDEDGPAEVQETVGTE